MKEKTVVQGYTIIERQRAGDTMVVVGHNPKAPDPYVTWKAYKHSGFASFEMGHYFSTLKGAMVDYYKRLAEVWEFFTPDRPQQPKKPTPPKRGGPER